MFTLQHGREVAKFLAGYAAAETIGHWALGIFFQNMLPFSIGNFQFTSTANLFCMFAWPVALAALVYVGWFMKELPKFKTAMH
jgi:hypothetical protein